MINDYVLTESLSISGADFEERTPSVIHFA